MIFTNYYVLEEAMTPDLTCSAWAQIHGPSHCELTMLIFCFCQFFSYIRKNLFFFLLFFLPTSYIEMYLPIWKGELRNSAAGSKGVTYSMTVKGNAQVVWRLSFMWIRVLLHFPPWQILSLILPTGKIGPLKLCVCIKGWELMHTISINLFGF